MTLQAKEDISDTLHQVHAFRESNRMLIRNIDVLSKQTQQLDTNNAHVSSLLTEARAQNIHTDDRHRNRMIKKKQLTNKIDDLKRQQARIDLEAL